MTQLAMDPVQAPTSPADPMTLKRGWPILAALTLATAVVTVDNTVLNVALPSIARDLRAGNGELQWIGNAYSLLFGGLLLTGGNLADRFGRKRVLLSGLVGFAAASALVVFVHGAVELIALRALIGAAAAFVMPSTLALMFRVFEGPTRQAAMGLWGAVAGIGFVAGPLLGGVILDHFSWHAVFLVNVPIASVALLAAAFTVPESADPTGARADLVGTVLSVATMGTFVYALVTGPDAGWTSSQVLASGACFLAALAAFVSWELHTAHPMLPLQFLRCSAFAGPAAAEGVLMFSAFGSLFLLTQLLQLVDGDSPLQAGICTAPIAAGTIASGVVGMRTARRFGAHVSCATGFGFGAIGLAILAFGVTHGYLPLAIGMFVFGAGLRMSITPSAIAVVDALPKERAGMGSALNDTFQEVGGALGVALIGSIFNVIYRATLPSGVPEAARSSITGAFSLRDDAVTVVARHAFESGAEWAICLGALAMAAAAFVVAKTVPTALEVTES